MNKATSIARRAPGLTVDLTAERDCQAQWRAENAAAVASYNDWVREHGLLLGPFRKT